MEFIYFIPSDMLATLMIATGELATEPTIKTMDMLRMMNRGNQ
jgi:hypothetical protein